MIETPLSPVLSLSVCFFSCSCLCASLPRWWGLGRRFAMVPGGCDLSRTGRAVALPFRTVVVNKARHSGVIKHTHQILQRFNTVFQTQGEEQNKKKKDKCITHRETERKKRGKKLPSQVTNALTHGNVLKFTCPKAVEDSRRDELCLCAQVITRPPLAPSSLCPLCCPIGEPEIYRQMHWRAATFLPDGMTAQKEEATPHTK